MNQQLLSILACPVCRRQPTLTSHEEPSPGRQAPGVPADEILSGLLSCPCGLRFPIVDGVPRLLERGLSAYPAVVEKDGQVRPPSGAVNGAHHKANGHQDDYDNIRASFSQEWGIFDYENDKTWGWTLAQRKAVFLSDVALRAEELQGRLLLDAGCGNGTLTAALTGFGLQVVGLDLNDGLGRAYLNRGKYSEQAVARANYVQGNLFNPPLREETFDLVYSSGVIHHTPSSRATFGRLVALTRKGGRLYVWVYGKRGLPVRAFFWAGRNLKRGISLKSVLTVCRGLAPGYRLAAGVLNGLGVMPFRPRTSREITLDLFDAFAPRYNHWHTEDEVRGWFKEHGFTNIHLSGQQKHGFGMYGDKA